MNLMKSALKITYTITGIAGIILAAVPLMNITGYGLLKLSVKALDNYYDLMIKETAALSKNEASSLLYQELNDYGEHKDPKIYIALAIVASDDDIVLTANLEKINKYFYEGKGKVIYDGEVRELSNDVIKVNSVLAPLLNEHISEHSPGP